MIVSKNEKIMNEKEQTKTKPHQDDDKKHDNNKIQRVNQTQQPTKTKVEFKQTQPTAPHTLKHILMYRILISVATYE